MRGDIDHIEGIYDLKNDPFEMEDPATQQKGMQLAANLLTKLKDWVRRTGDTFPAVPESARPTYSDAEAERARG